MSLTPLKTEHVEFVKTVLRGQWFHFADTELFLHISNTDYSFFDVLEVNEGGHERYVRRCINKAKRQITNSKNWPESIL